MSGRAKKKTAAAPKKKANGYKMPAPIATGEVIHDTLMKKKWRIGPSIGVGGFGEIYSACQHENSPKKGSDYPFVIKIEPHENGPLFVEKHFYVRNANKDDITKFMKSKKLTTFGMPTFDMRGTAPMTTRVKSTATWCWSATGRTCGHDLGYWNITNGTQRAELIYHASVIIYDEAPMAHKYFLLNIGSNNIQSEPIHSGRNITNLINVSNVNYVTEVYWLIDSVFPTDIILNRLMTEYNNLNNRVRDVDIFHMYLAKFSQLLADFF